MGVTMSGPKDSRGMPVRAGARVRLLAAPAELLEGLPAEDQAAILAAVGTELVVEDIDELDQAEILLKDRQGQIHFIWVSPAALEVIT